jgi:hypothetical protein
MSHEKYVPDLEDELKAEASMYESEKDLTKFRERVYEGVKAHAEKAGIKVENIGKINIQLEPGENNNWFNGTTVQGTIDGHKILLKEVDGAMGVYEGKVDGADISPEEANDLWFRYYFVAEQMTRLSRKHGEFPSAIAALEDQAKKDRAEYTNKAVKDLMRL